MDKFYITYKLCCGCKHYDEYNSETDRNEKLEIIRSSLLAGTLSAILLTDDTILNEKHIVSVKLGKE